MATFEDFVEAYRAHGATASLIPEHPVLVRFDGADAAVQRGYRTTLDRSPDDVDDYDSEEIGRSRPLGEVFEVRKRHGNPFPEQIGLGRAPNTDVSLQLAGLSKYHAVILLNGGSYSLADAGSKNGSYIDGRRLLTRESKSLSSGSRVRLGPYRFLFLTPPAFRQLIAARAR